MAARLAADRDRGVIEAPQEILGPRTPAEEDGGEMTLGMCLRLSVHSRKHHHSLGSDPPCYFILPRKQKHFRYCRLVSDGLWDTYPNQECVMEDNGFEREVS